MAPDLRFSLDALKSLKQGFRLLMGWQVLLGHGIWELAVVDEIDLPRTGLGLGVVAFGGLLEVDRAVDDMNLHPGGLLHQGSAVATEEPATVVRLLVPCYHSGRWLLLIWSSWAVIPHPEVVYRNSDSDCVSAAAHAYLTRC